MHSTDIPRDLSTYTNVVYANSAKTHEEALAVAYSLKGFNFLPYQKFALLKIETEDGPRIVRVHKSGGGAKEFLATRLFMERYPTVPIEKLIIAPTFELVVHPNYNPKLPQTNELFQEIVLHHFNPQKRVAETLKIIFLDALGVARETMLWQVQEVPNGEFFYGRLKTKAVDGKSGRVEELYSGKTFNIGGQEVTWEKLKDLKWVVDGVAYQETLSDLLEQARRALDPNVPRLTGLSQGDWHENHVIPNPEFPRYAYTHLEYAGRNDLLTDAVMFLVHTTVYADYLNPVFHSETYKANPKIDTYIEDTKKAKARNISGKIVDNTIQISRAATFGTLSSRKEIGTLFLTTYLDPLLKMGTEKFGTQFQSEATFRAAILLRLIGGQSIQRTLPPADQAKFFALVYKSVGTPTTGSTQPCLNRFMEAL